MLRRRNAGCLYLLQEVENQAGCIGTAAGRVSASDYLKLLSIMTIYAALRERQFLGRETQKIDLLSGILAIPPVTVEDMGISEPTEPYHFLRVDFKPGSWLTERKAGRRGCSREKPNGDVPNWKPRTARDTNHDRCNRWIAQFRP